MENTITIENHKRIISELNAEWKKKLGELRRDLTENKVVLQRTIIYEDEKKEIVSEWRSKNRIDKDGFLRDWMGHQVDP